jgi:tetratricopeptide (TPR) repeat protein
LNFSIGPAGDQSQPRFVDQVKLFNLSLLTRKLGIFKKWVHYFRMKFIYTFPLYIWLAVWSALPAMADQNDPELDELFNQLRNVDDLETASRIEKEIWAKWVHRDNELVDRHMSLGIGAMEAGALKLSLRQFTEVINLDENFSEGWNKRATVHYMMGNFNKSVQDIERTLALEPRHYGAMSGMALILDATENMAGALKAWQQVLEFTPYNQQIRARILQLKNEIRGKAI